MKLRPPGPMPPQEGSQLAPELEALPRGDLLLSYQQDFHKARSLPGLLVVEKSRRIGLTWGVAPYATLKAAKSRAEGGRNQFYISYALDMTREFIDYCAMWAKAFGLAASAAEEFLFEDQDPVTGETQYIKAFRIDFASGFRIQALSSAPRSLRGKQGDVYVDEAAFVGDLQAMIDAAIALTIWGGDVTIISTHYGVDNPFNLLIQQIRAGERLGRVITITFADAIAAGLYERICLVSRKEATEEGKQAFIAKTYGMYGAGASQELDCIPSKSGGAWLAFDLIERAEDKEAAVLRLAFDDAFAFKPDHIRRAVIEEWCERELETAIARLDRATYGVGGDVARTTDLSVIWLLKELQDRSWATPFVVEMRNVPFAEQEFVWTFLLRRLRRWRAKLDAQGLGMHLAERLVQIFGQASVEGVKARSDWWRDEGAPLKSRFEDGRITIPRDADLAADLRQVQVINGAPAIPAKRNTAKGEDAAAAAGKVKRHADGASALFHASAALRQGAAIDVGGEFTAATGAPAGFLSSGPDSEAVYEPLDFGGY